jgi:hypothetical protein
MRKDRSPALAPQTWPSVRRAIEEGDVAGARELALEGLADLEVTMRAAATFVERSHAFLDRLHGPEHVAVVWQRAPISSQEFNRSIAEAALTGLRDLVADESGRRLATDLDPALAEIERVHHLGYDLVALTLTCAAERLGEQIVEDLWREMLGDAWKFAGEMASLPMVERIRRINRMFGAHFGGPVTVFEEDGHYVSIHDPCGSGGRMRREGGFGGSVQFGRTTTAHPWSWGKAGVPYYCVHCCILWELDQVPNVGYPLRIHEGMDTDEPIKHHYFEDQEAVPDEYYSRLGAIPPGASRPTQPDAPVDP